jgi:two-component system, NarL family, nitrate/nitrite response regulator NarL
MAQIISTLLVDSNNLFREGLRRILSRAPFRIIAAAATYDEVIQDCSDKSYPNLLLLSTSSNAQATVSQIGRFKESYPEARVVVLSDTCDLNSVLSALEAGASGFLLKNVEHGILTKSLGLVMLGETVLSSSVVELFTRQSKNQNRIPSAASLGPADAGDSFEGSATAELGSARRRFSHREAEILECLTRGEANKLIARKFDIAEATVKVHIKAILRKIRVKNRTQAAIWAQNNLVGAREVRLDENLGASVGESSQSPSSLLHA